MKHLLRCVHASPTALGIFLLCAWMTGVPANASEIVVPERTRVIVTALKGSKWQEIQGGMGVLRAITPGGLVMTAFRISSEKFQLEIVASREKRGERATDIAGAMDIILAVNAGFFSEDTETGQLAPVGLMKLANKVSGVRWEKSGGYLVLEKGSVSLLPSTTGKPKVEGDVLQSKPMLIEPGGKWAMNTNQGRLERRTILCLQDDGNVVLSVITRSGASLYEAGWVMRNAREGGFFGCDSALALDGGGSTQIWVRDHPQFSFSGITPVHNFLVLKPVSE